MTTRPLLLSNYLNRYGLEYTYFSDYVNEYRNNESLIKTIMKNKYGNLILKYDVEETKNLVSATLFVNKYTQDKLYRSTNLDYNPIFNVEEKETVTTEYGERIENNTIGAKNILSEHGERVINNEYGERIIDNEHGEKVIDNEYGEKEKTTTISKYPYDTQTPTPTNIENVVDNKNSDKITENSYTDKETHNTYSDTITNNEYTDNTTESERRDTKILNTHVDKVTREREGNIGVQSSQHLIEEERKVADFSFWLTVIDIVVREITIPIYEMR